MKNHYTIFLVFFSTILALYANTYLVVSVLELIILPFEFTRPIITIVLCFAVTGAISAFLFSVFIARFMIGVTLINQPATYLEKWLFTSVKRQSNQLGIRMPQVGVFYASELNAFTTGWGQKNAMFAVSSGLLENLDQQELEAVIGHELAHIENSDMISLSLAQGVLKSTTFLPARLMGIIFDKYLLRGKSYNGIFYSLTYWLSMITMGLLPHFIVMWFSRRREYSADKASAAINGADKMIAALKTLSRNKHYAYLNGQSPALGIAGGLLEGLVGGMNGIKTIFSSHPSLNNRINAIETFFPDKYIQQGNTKEY